MAKLSILSIGAGAIGTYIGGSLALRGHEVIYLERPGIADDLRNRGLRLTLGKGEHRIPNPQMVSDLEKTLASYNFDAALFALKSFDTDSFLSTVSDLKNFPPILCLSNGVENEPLLADALGQERVIAGTVTTAIGRRAPGVIQLEKLRGVGINTGHDISERLVTAFNDAGLNAQLFSRAADMKWSKMLTNLMANA